ncbi:MAG: hypothetical protein M3140_12235 [Actinomycetota bacterium]|nr:hypothetical protein [Actinomycetota bacterium]
MDLSAYRLVQEALTNCLRHAGPARVAVLTRYDTDRLTLRIDDDGPVPDVDATARRRNGGHGLVAMRERVALVGGRFEVGPGPDGGWRVHAELPVPPSAAEDPG